MLILNSMKERARYGLVQSMRKIVDRDRLPFLAKYLYLNGCQLLLPALGIQSDRTPVTSVYGTKFVAGPGSAWLNSILRYRGVWEPALSEFILRNVGEGDVCVDAGANCGYFSLLLAQRVGVSGKVIAIEAAPENVQRLRENVELNGVTDIVDVVMAACAPQKGEIQLHLHPRNDAWHRITPPAKGQVDRRYMGRKWNPVTVPADTLRSIVGDAADQVTFIKIHIQGGEAAIAPDIPETFRHPELVVALLAMAPNIEATLRPFKEHGFFVYDQHNDYRWLYQRKVPAITQASYDDFKEQHVVFVILSRRPLTLP